MFSQWYLLIWLYDFGMRWSCIIIVIAKSQILRRINEKVLKILWACVWNALVSGERKRLDRVEIKTRKTQIQPKMRNKRDENDDDKGKIKVVEDWNERPSSSVMFGAHSLVSERAANTPLHPQIRAYHNTDLCFISTCIRWIRSLAMLNSDIFHHGDHHHQHAWKKNATHSQKFSVATFSVVPPTRASFDCI